MELSFFLLILLLGLTIHSDYNRYFRKEKIDKIEEIGFGIDDLKLDYTNIFKSVDRMGGQQFEKFIMFILNVLGYQTEATPSTGDYGGDVIIYQDGLKIVIQAKRYSKKVGIKAVQEVLGAISKYEANQGIVITNNSFTQKAHKLATSSNVDLWDRTALIQLIKAAKSQLGFD